MSKWLIVQADRGAVVHVLNAESVRMVLDKQATTLFSGSLQIPVKLLHGGTIIECDSLSEARERAQLLVSGPKQPPDPH